MKEKIKEFITSRGIQLKILVELAGLTANDCKTFTNWVGDRIPTFNPSKLAKIEAVLREKYGYRDEYHETDLYPEIQRTIDNLYIVQSRFESVRDYERQLTDKEKQAYETLNFVADLLSRLKMSEDVVEGEYFFGQEARFSDISKTVLDFIESQKIPDNSDQFL